MQKVLFTFLLVAVAAVLAHPSDARDDALAPAVIAADAAPAPEQPPAIPEEQPTSQALLDDVTSVPVTLPAEQEISLPGLEGASNDNSAVPNVLVNDVPAAI